MATSTLAPLLPHLKQLVANLGCIGCDGGTDSLEKLKEVVFATTSAARSPTAIVTEADACCVCEASFEIWVRRPCQTCRSAREKWEKCVTLANSCLKGEPPPWLARLRHIASELLGIVKDGNLTHEQHVCKVTFFYKTALSYVQLKDYETAEICFEKAIDAQDCKGGSHQDISRLAELATDRAINAWRLQQEALANASMQKALQNARHDSLPRRQQSCLCFNIAAAYADRGRELISLHATANEILEKAYQLLMEELCVHNCTNADAGDGGEESALPNNGLATSLCEKLLNLMALDHLENGKHSQALACVQKLRQDFSSSAEIPSVPYMAMCACLGLGRTEDAAGELLAVAAVCGSELFMQALTRSTACPDMKRPSLKQAVLLILERLSIEAVDLVVPIVAAFLLNRKAEDISTEDDEVVLEIVGNEEVSHLLKQDDPSANKQRMSLFKILWNHASARYHTGVYEASLKVFSAALFYADALQPKVARQLSMCCIVLRQLDKAEQYGNLAEELEPGSIFTTFLKLKIYLLRQDHKNALTQLRAMVACADFTQDYLQVACQEAMDVDALAVAKAALLELHGMLVKEATKPGHEAFVLRCLIQVIIRFWAARQAPGLSTQAEDAVKTANEIEAGPGLELSQYFYLATQRLRALGCDRFFGTDDRLKEQEWFAVNAWNAALDAARAADYMGAAVLFSSYADFYAARPGQDLTTLSNVRMGLLMGATAAIETYKQRPEHANSLSLAQKMLDQCAQAGQAVMRLPQAAHQLREDKVQLFMHIQEFELAICLGDSQAQMALVESFRRAPEFSGQRLLRLARLAMDAPNEDQEVTCAALDAALARLLETMPCVPIDLVAMTIRALMERRSDAAKLALLQKATDVIMSLPQDGSYPAKEILWLLTTAWNRGCHAAIFARHKEAASYMGAALGLLRFCPDLQTSSQVLEAEYHRIIKLQPD